MIELATPRWLPRDLLEVTEVFQTSMGTFLGRTDAGPAYIKPLGGGGGSPHKLACELVGTRLAQWFGLSTLEWAVLELTPLDIDLIKQKKGEAQPGSAFATKAVSPAHTWDGTQESMKSVSNSRDISRLVAFDTWTRNWDRHSPGDRKPNYDNILIANSPDKDGSQRMFVIDHGECFTSSQELSRRISFIGEVQDPRIYGLFDGFKPFIWPEAVSEAARRLGAIERSTIQEFVDDIPADWGVPDDARSALVDLICRRGEFLADKLEDKLRHSNDELF